MRVRGAMEALGLWCFALFTRSMGQMNNGTRTGFLRANPDERFASRILNLSGYSTTSSPTTTPTVGIGFNPPDDAADVLPPSADNELVEELEDDDRVTVQSIQLGKLLCESLVNAEDAPVLHFAMGPDEIITANKKSYTEYNGSIFADGITRKVWTGEVVHNQEEVSSQEASMTWGDVCDVETFLLEIPTKFVNGTLIVSKTKPCAAGGAFEICVVELEIELPEERDPEVREIDVNVSVDVRRLRGAQVQSEEEFKLEAETGDYTSVGRQLQSTTQIDLMFLYTPGGRDILGVSDTQMQSELADYVDGMNDAMANSDVDLQFSLVRVEPLPYTEESTTSSTVLDNLEVNSDVAELRNTYGADLVQLVADLNADTIGGSCGLAHLPSSPNDLYAFGVVDPYCFFQFSHTHEIAHNMGCYHNRESSNTQHEYAHGYRYCDGDLPYRTIMAYACLDDNGFALPVNRVRFFSNPDVMHNGKPTGTTDDNCARRLKETMGNVANYRDSSAISPTAAPTTKITSAPTTPITPAPTTPITPAPTAWITPAPTIPITPAPTTPITPAPTTPITPAPTTPITPAPTAPITPAPTILITPAPTTPITPAPTTPITPAPTTPITPAPTTPITPAPTASITSAPTTPITPAPTTPITPAPTASNTSAPTTPITPAPTASITSAPTTPITAAPTAPITPAPTTPITPAPTAPNTLAPTTPITPAPTNPITPAPTAPNTPAPTTPITAAPTAWITPAPTTPITPAPTAPNTLAPATPITPAPTTPITPAPTTPITPAPTASITPAPTTPITLAPTTPITPAPTSPITPAPTTPITPAPTASITSAPTTPITPAPTTPITPAPTASNTSAPTTPITPAPTASITSAPTTPITPAPTTPITPAPTAWITPAPTTPITPAPTAPNTLAPTTPITPASTTPITPAPTTPITPAPTTPITPAPTTPITPAPTTPITPAPTASITSAPTTPITPAPTTPITPAPTTPITPAPTTPITPAPTASITSAPTTPITPAPTTPITPAPTAWIKPAPMTPITPAPTAPNTLAPTTPITPAPTTPVTPAPTASITSAPTIPITPAPTASIVSAPTIPITPAPTDPKAPAPTAPITPAPTTPITPALTPPITSEPTTLITPVPTAPKTSKPATPITPAPTAPTTPMPTTPITPAPTASITSAPTTPITPEPTTPITPTPTAPITPEPMTPITPAPTTPITPAPTILITPVLSTSTTTTCSNGITGVERDGFCCALGCITCGGSGCSQRASEAGLTSEDCCVTRIDESGVYCEDSGTAPCIFGEAPSLIPMPILSTLEMTPSTPVSSSESSTPDISSQTRAPGYTTPEPTSTPPATELVEAGERTTVVVGANGYDERTFGNGCAPDGCKAENTRDGSLSTRWACKESLLGGTNCEITFEFGEPQNLDVMRIAFYKGTERTRKLKVKINGSKYTEIVSSGQTDDFEDFELGADGTSEITLEGLELGSDDWIALTEIQLIVP